MSDAVPAPRKPRRSDGRCFWVSDDPLYLAYHDNEWGVPSRDARHLFEMITLEGAQAGLSWITILRKRENYRKAFDHFDVDKVARYTPARIEKLLADPGIVRNRLKVESTVSNARAIVALRDEGTALPDFLWSFVGGRPIQNALRDSRDGATRTPQSDAMSKGLQKRGFRFVGTTICYAFMQATGMVNDHEIICPCHARVAKLA